MPSLGELIRRNSGTIREYAVPVAANVIGGVIGRRATGSAANALQAGGQQAIDTVRQGQEGVSRTLGDVWKRQQALLGPYREAGAPALDALRAGTEGGGQFSRPFTMADFELYKDPGYQFRVREGERALKAEANAGGTRWSGATLKAITGFGQDMASQEAQAAYGRFQDDTDARYNRLMGVANIGQNAANAEVGAGADYGTNLAMSQQQTARTLADLQTDLASAQAAGDVAKANSITGTINGILGSVADVGLRNALGRIVGGGAGALATGAGLTTGTLAAPGTAALSSQMAGLASAGQAGGLGSTLSGLATNPITMAAAGALGVGLLWRKSQAHHEAKDWVTRFQDPFDKTMAAIDQQNLDPQAKDELKRIHATDYIAAALQFARDKGSDGQTVIRQAFDTFRRWYPQFSNLTVGRTV